MKSEYKRSRKQRIGMPFIAKCIRQIFAKILKEHVLIKVYEAFNSQIAIWSQVSVFGVYIILIRLHRLVLTETTLSN